MAETQSSVDNVLAAALDSALPPSSLVVGRRRGAGTLARGETGSSHHLGVDGLRFALLHRVKVGSAQDESQRRLGDGAAPDALLRRARVGRDAIGVFHVRCGADVGLTRVEHLELDQEDVRRLFLKSANLEVSAKPGWHHVNSGRDTSRNDDKASFKAVGGDGVASHNSS